jgi:hypothetical protein
MSEDNADYDDEDDLVTSHSDENPELSQRRGGPLAAHSLEDSPVADLYKKDRDMQRTFGYRPRDGEQVTEEDVYIPPDEEPPN